MALASSSVNARLYGLARAFGSRRKRGIESLLVYRDRFIVPLEDGSLQSGSNTV
jgi:hypothetical protein